jgi:hypothetical protein
MRERSQIRRDAAEGYRAGGLRLRGADSRRGIDRRDLTMSLETETSTHDHRSTQTLCFTAPLLPGTTSVDREEMLSCWHGERTEEHDRSRRRHGISRESVWIQGTPAGDVAVVLIESPDLPTALYGLATSDEPFDRWFREHVIAVHGFDLSAGMSLPEPVLEYGA